MPIFELNPQMMREIIMDHYSNPRHKGVPTGEGYTKTHSSAVNCIDDIDIYLKSSDGKVIDAMWEGTACTISTASTNEGDRRRCGQYKLCRLRLIEEPAPCTSSGEA